MSYRISLAGQYPTAPEYTAGPRIAIEEAEDGHNTLAQTYSRAKLLAGWPAEPNVRELTPDEIYKMATPIWAVGCSGRLP